jgi:glycosyltransferase involved in cell wall biosynthesis
MTSKENPLVSIIIPMFNAQEWIVGLLQSILNQTYKNIEVILINDGSTDESLTLVNKFSKDFREIRLKVVNQANTGVSEARNEGVRNSIGELLAFVDSDDIWIREKIERQVRAMIKSDVAATACSYAIFRDSDLEILDVVHPDWSTHGVRNWLLFRSYGGLLSSTLMLRREVFYETGPFKIDLSLSADIDFAWRLLSVNQVVLIREPLVGYRLRPNQMHKLPDLLISESKRILNTVSLFQSNKFSRIYLANLNLRLFLYRAQDGDFRNGLQFLLKAFRFNFLEVCVTTLRILSSRIFRKFKYAEKKSFVLPNP